MAQEFVLNGFASDASRTFLMGKSPFPALDVFVEHVASIGNESGDTLSNKAYVPFSIEVSAAFFLPVWTNVK